MNVQVLAIESNAENQWNVQLRLDQQEAVYSFMQEELVIGNRPVVGIASDPAFRKFFKFNQPIVNQITRLLIQRVNGEAVEFPVEVGQFLTPEPSEEVLLAE